MKNIIVWLTLLPFAAWSQSSTQESEIKAIVSKYYAALNEYYQSESSNTDPLSLFFSSDFVLTRYTEKLNGEVTTTVFNKEAYLNELHTAKLNIGLRFEYTKPQFMYSYVEGNLGTASATMHVLVKGKEGDTVALYTVNVYTVLELIENKWYIHAMISTRTAEIQKIGVCPCKVIQTHPNDQDNYTLIVHIPSGTSIIDEKLDVRFIPTGTGFSFLINGQGFMLDNEKLYTAPTGNKSQGEFLGRATSRRQAVTMALKQSIYKNRCISFKTY